MLKFFFHGVFIALSQENIMFSEPPFFEEAFFFYSRSSSGGMAYK